MNARRQIVKLRQPSLPKTTAAAAAAAPRVSDAIQTTNRSVTTCWIFLICSILLECLDTTCSKLAQEKGSTLLFFLACSLNLISMYGINISMTRIPVSVAYTVWTALGTLVVTIMGACLFHEPMGWWQAFCLAMITVGVIGLNLEE